MKYLLAIAALLFTSHTVGSPKSIRYTYVDNTSVEVACGKDGEELSERIECTLIVEKGDVKSSFPFSLHDYGYEYAFINAEFDYSEINGAVSFPVTCIDRDITTLQKKHMLSLHSGDEREFSCRIFLFPVDDALVADRVEVNFYNDGIYYKEAWFFSTHSPEP